MCNKSVLVGSKIYSDLRYSNLHHEMLTPMLKIELDGKNQYTHAEIDIHTHVQIVTVRM